MKRSSSEYQSSILRRRGTAFNSAVALGVFLVAFVLAGVIISFLPKTYQSNATILVRPMSDFVLDPTEAAIGGSFQERVNNQVALLRSDQTAQRAQSYLKEFLQTKRCSVCEAVLPDVRLGLLNNEYKTGSNYGERLRQSLDVKPQPDSHIVRVAYRSSMDRPQDLKTLLALYLSAFQSEAATFGRQMVQEQLKSVHTQRSLARENQQQAEKTLEAFQNTHQTLDPNLQLNAWVMEQARLRDALRKTEAEQKAAEAGQKEASKRLVLSVPTVQWLSRFALDEELIGLRQQVVEIYAEKYQWLVRAGMVSKAQALEKPVSLSSEGSSGNTAQEKIGAVSNAAAATNAAIASQLSPDPALSIKLQTLDEEIDYLNQLIQKRVQMLLGKWRKMAGQKPSAAIQKQLEQVELVSLSPADVSLAIAVLEQDIQLQALKAKQASLQQALGRLDGQLKQVPALQLDFAKLQAQTQLSKDRLNFLALQQSRLETAQLSGNASTGAIPKLIMLRKPITPVEPVSPHYPLLYALSGLFACVLGIMAGKLSASRIEVNRYNQRNSLEVEDFSQIDSEPLQGNELGQDNFVAIATGSHGTNQDVGISKKKKAAPGAGFFQWPFKDNSSKKEKPVKSEKRILQSLPQSGRKLGNIAPDMLDATNDDSEMETAPAFKRTFHLDPLPSLPSFIMQLEGENPPAFQTKALEDLRQFFVRMRQQSRIQRIGFITVSAFPTAQSTLLALSLLLTESGQKLVLIDLDFGQSSLSRWVSTFPIPLARGVQEGPGVSEYVEGLSPDFVDVIYPLGKSVYGSFIPAGHLGGMKDIHLGSEHLVKMGGEMSPHYDFVFYALPSLEHHSQSLQTAASLDAVVLVTHPGITKKRDEQHAIQMIQQQKLPLLAILEQP